MSVIALAMASCSCGVSGNPTSEPLPDLRSSGDLTQVINRLSVKGGSKSDKAVFLRWLQFTIQKIANNGFRGIEQKDLPSTVGAAINEQRQRDELNVQADLQKQIEWMQTLCEKYNESSNKSAFVQIHQGPFSVNGVAYDTPCEAVEANGASQ